MTWNCCVSSGWPPLTKIVHRPECERASAQGKVPNWTREDEANLRHRIQRIAAQAKP